MTVNLFSGSAPPKEGALWAKDGESVVAILSHLFFVKSPLAQCRLIYTSLSIDHF